MRRIYPLPFSSHCKYSEIFLNMVLHDSSKLSSSTLLHSVSPDDLVEVSVNSPELFSDVEVLAAISSPESVGAVSAMISQYL